MADPDLLATGIYTAPEAAYLIGTTQRKVRGWVEGYAKRQAPPIIDNELGWIDGRLAFSFTNLMEIRFIAFFEAAGLHFWHIRSIMEEAKKTLNHPHPFATNIVFRTDGRKILAEIVQRNGEKKLLDLRSKNWEMRPIVFDTLKDGVVYDASGGVRAWYPRHAIYPDVMIHPRFAFGRPILESSKIPTHTISEAVRAERAVRPVAQQFEISEKQVKEAFNFELSLRNARQSARRDTVH